MKVHIGKFISWYKKIIVEDKKKIMRCEPPPILIIILVVGIAMLICIVGFILRTSI